MAQKRYKLQIEYQGTAYSGWQIQTRHKGTKTIQECIEQAFVAFTGQHVRVHGAGRTDTGVHAIHQVAHVDLDLTHPVETLPKAMNFFLPKDIRIRGAWEVDFDFHARFAACRREYTMLLWQNVFVPPVWADRVQPLKRPLDPAFIEVALQSLRGVHDFQPFALKEPPERRTVRTFYEGYAQAEGDLVSIHLAADGFLRRQVRIMTGAIVELSKRGLPPETLLQWLKDPAAMPHVAAIGPNGLYLSRVEYPDPWDVKVETTGMLPLPWPSRQTSPRQ